MKLGFPEVTCTFMDVGPLCFSSSPGLRLEINLCCPQFCSQFHHQPFPISKSNQICFRNLKLVGGFGILIMALLAKPSYISYTATGLLDPPKRSLNNRLVFGGFAHQHSNNNIQVVVLMEEMGRSSWRWSILLTGFLNRQQSRWGHIQSCSSSWDSIEHRDHQLVQISLRQIVNH